MGCGAGGAVSGAVVGAAAASATGAALATRVGVAFLALAVLLAVAFAFGLVLPLLVIAVSVAGLVSVTESVVTGAVSTTGGGAMLIGSGSAVGWTSCDQAGVEESARTAAIAGRALACAYVFVFHIMPHKRSSRRSAPAIIVDTSLGRVEPDVM